jgi:peptidoglycan/LPS O-acetylase OafA/YrhL
LTHTAWPEPGNGILNYLLSLLLVQNLWGLDLNPGINVPFWSLSYEFAFYMLFAFAIYFKGVMRVLAVVGCALVVGPDILTYMPIWLLGVLAYVLHKKQARMPLLLSSTLAVSSALILLFLTPMLAKDWVARPGYFISSRNVFGDYACAMLFFVHLYSVRYFIAVFSWPLVKASGPIRWLAGCTFSLYLFHRPLIQFFAALEVGPVDSLANRALVLGGTLLVVFSLGYVVERQKYRVKRGLQFLFSKRLRLTFKAEQQSQLGG